MPDRSETRVEFKLTSLISLILVVTLAGVLAWTSVRYSKEFDWTREGRHSLSETAVRILEQLQGPVNITAYAREDGDLRGAIERYIEKYQSVKPDISLDFVNPDSAPDRVRELGIHINGELIFEYQGRTENVRAADETTIINALVRLNRKGERWIAYVSGHGERNLMGQANHDLGEFGNQLSKRGYHLQPLNLAEVPQIPDNTGILVLAGPQLPLLPGETDMLMNYLRRGGAFLWLIDPDDSQLPRELIDFLSVDVARGTVIDVAGKLVGIDDPTVTMITKSLYGQHPIVKNFEYTTLFPGAAVLLPADNQEWTTTALLMSASHTWLETGPPDVKPSFDADNDLQGPLTIGLSLTRSIGDNGRGEQRVVILGDGDFLSNTYLANAGNLDLGLRIVDWLSHDEELISIPARPATDTHLAVSSFVVGIVGIFFLAVLPVSLFSTGLIIRWRRRRN